MQSALAAKLANKINNVLKGDNYYTEQITLHDLGCDEDIAYLFVKNTLSTDKQTGEKKVTFHFSSTKSYADNAQIEQTLKDLSALNKIKNLIDGKMKAEDLVSEEEILAFFS